MDRETKTMVLHMTYTVSICKPYLSFIDTYLLKYIYIYIFLFTVSRPGKGHYPQWIVFLFNRRTWTGTFLLCVKPRCTHPSRRDRPVHCRPSPGSRHPGPSVDPSPLRSPSFLPESGGESYVKSSRLDGSSQCTDCGNGPEVCIFSTSQDTFYFGNTVFIWKFLF